MSPHCLQGQRGRHCISTHTYTYMYIHMRVQLTPDDLWYRSDWSEVCSGAVEGTMLDTGREGGRKISLTEG